MIMPCDCRVNCPGTDSPFLNLTAEAPDVIVFIGNSWGWNNNVPPIGSTYSKINCYATCTSTVSQQDADLCAAQLQLDCTVHPGPFPCDGNCTSDGGPGWNDGGDPNNPVPVQTYRNAAAFCTVDCPDGNPFTYTVRAGLFSALDQITADRMAIALACQNARVNAVCLGALNPSACINQPYFTSVTVTGGLAPFSFAITNGALPPGVGSFQDSPNSFSLSGQPSASGNYVFTLTVTDSRGNFMSKTYTVYVLSQNSIPSPVIAVPYSNQIEINGGVAPYTFSNATGLPAGLTMNATGLVSGTPTGSSTGFSFNVVDSLNNRCTLAIAFGADCAVVSFTTNSPLSNATQSSPYSSQLAATGGTAPYTFTLFSGTLPAGLSMTAAGLISGTPTGTGNSSFTVRVTDSLANGCSKLYTMTVDAAGVCAGRPVNIQDVTFTRTIAESPGCNTGQIVNGTCAAWLMKAGGGCPNSSGPFINWNGTLCNPTGAPYDITITVNWSVSGTSAPGSNIFQISGTVDSAFPPHFQNGDITTGLPSTLSFNLTIPPGTHGIFIQIGGTNIGAPQLTYQGDLHITPLTHP